MTRRIFLALTLVLGTLPLASPAGAAERFIIVASTTSTENSGLFDHILPAFEAETGIQVRVVAVGTGAALKLGRNGDADVLLVHAKEAEEAFVADGHAAFRRDVMYNDFVIVGPASDPAGVRGMDDAPAALARIAEAKADFVSRGDNSGTHKAELKLWEAAGVSPDAASGDWYKETGQGMGAVLNTASGLDGYALTDRGTWLSFGNRGSLEVLVEGDSRLFNQYGVLLVNPQRHGHVKVEAARAFIDWLTGEAGQKAIGTYKVGGEQLFRPNARPPKPAS